MMMLRSWCAFSCRGQQPGNVFMFSSLTLPPSQFWLIRQNQVFLRASLISNHDRWWRSHVVLPERCLLWSYAQSPAYLVRNTKCFALTLNKGPGVGIRQNLLLLTWFQRIRTWWCELRNQRIRSAESHNQIEQLLNLPNRRIYWICFLFVG